MRRIVAAAIIFPSVYHDGLPKATIARATPTLSGALPVDVTNGDFSGVGAGEVGTPPTNSGFETAGGAVGTPPAAHKATASTDHRTSLASRPLPVTATTAGRKTTCATFLGAPRLRGRSRRFTLRRIASDSAPRQCSGSGFQTTASSHTGRNCRYPEC